jgi:heme-degrading monooxygenase HmoA
MLSMLVRHHVQDYAKWRPGYDVHGSVRRAGGCTRTQGFRDSKDPNEIVLLLKWDNLANARTFAQSQDLRETIQRLGVEGQPWMTPGKQQRDLPNV